MEGQYIPSFEDDELQAYTVDSLRQNTRLELFPVATIATRNNARIQAQMGTFTIHHNKKVAIEEVGDRSHVAKYTIPHAARETLAEELNRLCASGLDAVGSAARAISCGEMALAVAGGVESMSRAPFVMGKTAAPFGRDQKLEDTTMGWRFVNPALDAMYGTETMPRTGENVAAKYGISRADQDVFALRSQQRAIAAQQSGFHAAEIVGVDAPGRKRGETATVTADEHPRADTTLETLSRLKGLFGADGTVTAGNASGINDGAAAMIVASEAAAREHGLIPRARILGMASAGVEPAIMGIGPVPATQKLLARLGFGIGDFDAFELNEAFASQSLAVMRALGLADDAENVNANGGAIALGHPLGMSGARIAMTLVHQLERSGGKRGIATLCVGVGMGLALAVERV